MLTSAVAREPVGCIGLVERKVEATGIEPA
jgi:hypothetical protein